MQAPLKYLVTWEIFKRVHCDMYFCSLRVSVYTASSTLHPRVVTSRTRLELDYKSLNNVVATPDLHSPQVLNSINSTCYALRLSAPQFMLRERYLSATFASKPDNSASHTSRELLRKFSVKDLAIPQRTRGHYYFANYALRPTAQPPFPDHSWTHWLMYM